MKYLTFKNNWITVLLAAFLATMATWPSASAQGLIEKPGVVSQLTINNLGYLQCDMHANDAVAAEHHSMGKTNADFEARAQRSVVKRKKNAQGAEIFTFYFLEDPDFPIDQFFAAITAFQSAVDIWSENLSSDVPIFVAAVFQPLDEGVLGAAGTTSLFANFPGFERNTWYGSALADKLAGEDLAPLSFDIVANFSTVFPNWYFGTDGNTPGDEFDFRTIVLHELCHGLNFFGSMFVDNETGVGSYGFGIPNPVFPAIYDRLMYTADGKAILKENRYPNSSTALGDALLGDPLTAKGPRIKKATTGKGAKIFTILDSDIFGEIPGLTDSWLPGSSYSHVDFLTYFGGPNGLMVPFLSTGLSYSSPGDIVSGIFDDIGWNGKVNREVMARISQTDLLQHNTLPSSHRVTVFPNPVKHTLTVKLEENTSALVHANLIDALGRKHALSFTPGQQLSSISFDLAELPLKPGLFTLQLGFENEEVSNFKVMKMK